MKARTITPSEPEWPQGLDELGGQAPIARLNVVGRELPPMEGAIAIVGTRRPTSTGLETAKSYGRAVAEAGFAVVSGLAMGVDAAAHLGAIEAGGHTIAVVGCGLDVVYPRRNQRLRARIASSGTIVSEYDEGTQPNRWNFPERNRIIAGLCRGVIVVEGSLRSGALITARHALDAGREVWAVPGSIRNPMAVGPNELIRTGQASLVQGIEHVFEELAPRLLWNEGPRAAEPPDLADDDASVLSALDDAPTPTDLIGRACGFAGGRLAMALTRLEVRGFALRRSAGYSITDSGARARMALATSSP